MAVQAIVLKGMPKHRRISIVPYLEADEALGGNGVLIACADEAQVRALRLEGLQVPSQQQPASPTVLPFTALPSLCHEGIP